MIGRIPALSRAARRDERGAALMEFGFVAPVLLLMIMAGFDAGYAVYVQAVASGTLEARARAASLDGATESQFDREIREAMYDILPAYAENDENIVLTKKNYTDYSRIAAAEQIVSDDNHNGILDPGDCWLDEDGNEEYGTNQGADGLGSADDGVYYTVELKFPRLFPMAQLIGLPAEQNVTVRTLVINQPYGTQQERPTICLDS
jgi:hypothetical protein